jgi:putative cardiolipin synthase
MIVGGIQMRLKGWSLIDGIHEKLFVVDGERLLTTGRGQTDFYLNWLDSAYLIRGELARQSQQAFEEIWATCRRETPLFSQKGDLAQTLKPAPSSFVLTPEERVQMDRLQEWLKASRTTGSESPPLRGRLLHHDFLKQMRALPKDPKDYDDNQRLRILQDPIIQALAVKLRGSQDVRFNTLSVMLHPDFRAPLFEASHQGAKVRIFTNTREAYHAISPVAAPWIVALPELEEVLNQGIQVDGFTGVAGKPHVYLHRKLAIVDDTTFIGSHNFNLPSTVANDEVSFEIEGASFANKMRELFDGAVRDYGSPIQKEEVARQRRHTLWGRELFRPFLGIF